jgi:RNA polymerase sigma factor (sigma-70 family)
MSPLEPPPPDIGLSLHRRLCEGDPWAQPDLIRSYLGWLAAWLAATHPRADPDCCDQAAADALWDLCRHPARYDPQRSPLAAYLRLAARRDLQNLQARERRHRHRSLEDVEDDPVAGKYLGRQDDPLRALQNAEDQAAAAAVVAAVAAGLDEADRRVLDLWLQGERSTARIAQAVGLSGLPGVEQAHWVKRSKDRIQKRLRRGGRA